MNDVASAEQATSDEESRGIETSEDEKIQASAIRDELPARYFRLKAWSWFAKRELAAWRAEVGSQA